MPGRVAVDLDGVLANTMASCCRIINLKHSTHYEVASFIRWKAWETADIPRDEFFRTLDEAWLDWRTIPPTEGQIAEKVEALTKFSRVDIVTGRSPGTVAAARSWLKNQGIKFNSFVRTNSSMDKLELDYEVFIDDSPELMAALTAKPDRNGILYTQPWNREFPIPPRIYRVDRWSQIPETARQIMNLK